MKLKLSAVWSWLNNTDEGTWVGHWLQGLAGFWVGYLGIVWATGLPAVAAMSTGVLTGFLVVVVTFAHREGDNFLAGVREYGARLAVRKKGLDGIMDWLMPAFGCFCSMNLVWGGFGAFIGTVIASAAVWFGVFLAKQVRA